MVVGNYNVIVFMWIYVFDLGDNIGGVVIKFIMVNVNIIVVEGVYFVIYVDGDVVIDGLNFNVLVLVKGEIIFVNVFEGIMRGCFIVGGGVGLFVILRVMVNEVLNNIFGICGWEVIEVLNYYCFELVDNKGSSCVVKEVILKVCVDVNCDLFYF